MNHTTNTHAQGEKRQALTKLQTVLIALGIISSILYLVTDMTASVMCMENKMPLMVFGLNEDNSILNAMTGKFNGTVVTVD